MNETSSIMDLGESISMFNSTTVRPKSDFNNRLFGFKDYGITDTREFGFVVIWYATQIFCVI